MGMVGQSEGGLNDAASNVAEVGLQNRIFRCEMEVQVVLWTLLCYCEEFPPLQYHSLNIQWHEAILLP